MADLITAAVRNQVMLEGLKTEEVNQFAAFLKRIDLSLRDRLSSVDLTGYSRDRIEKLLSSVDDALGAIFADYYDLLSGRLTEIGEYQAGFESRSIDNVLKAGGFDISTVIPAATQVHAAIFSVPLAAGGGKLLEPFIKDWTKSERDRVTGAIRQGFFEGQTTNEILQRVRGTKKNNYSDGILSIANRDAEAIVRTAVQHSASVARMETLNANNDIVDEYQIVATLDGKTSQQCRSLDGRRFVLGKGPLPPFHIRCRTTFIAVLSGQYAFLSEGRTRASQDGYVDGNQTYYDWLKDQPKSFQDHALGPTRGELFRKGGLSADRFAELNLDRNFQPMTLSEMRKKEPLAFQNAGLNDASFRTPAQGSSPYDRGSVKVSPDISTPARKALVEAENQIRNDKMETAFVVDNDGNKIFTKTGDPDKVALPIKIFDRAGLSMTHNHPGGFAFSPDDIVNASSLSMSEMRAVTEQFRHIMRPGKNGWPDEAQILAALKKAEKTAKNRTDQLVKEDAVHKENAQQEYLHQLWVVASHRLGMTYIRERS